MCKVEWCNCDKILANGLCSKHYNQLRRYGKIFRYSYRDKENHIEVLEDHAEIFLINKNNEVAAKALIDIEDIDKVKSYKWHLSVERDKYNYVISNNSPDKKLHRFIMDAPKNTVVDHINHNPLDNRKSNLRICSNQQNICNCELAKNNTSGVKGVYWAKDKQKWTVQVTINNKTKYIGRYSTLEEAIKAREEAAKKYYGEYAYEDYSKN